MIRDLNQSTSVEVARAAAAITSNTTSNGSIIDLQGCGGVLFVLTVSARTDGTYTPTITVGNDSGLSDGVAADASILQGTLAGAALSANGVSKVGLRANQGYRYARINIVSTSVTSGATVGANAIKFDLSFEV